MQLKLENTKSTDRHKKAYENVVNNPEFQKWFEGSKIVDENGNPQVFYHATVYDFDSFDPSKGQFGNHLGSLEQATRVATDNYLINRDENRWIPIFVKMKKPLVLFGDMVNWNYSLEVMKKIMDSHYVDQGFKTYMEENNYKMWTRFELKAALLKFGYDGIVYENTKEANFESAVIIFHKNQTWSLYANSPM